MATSNKIIDEMRRTDNDSPMVGNTSPETIYGHFYPGDCHDSPGEGGRRGAITAPSGPETTNEETSHREVKGKVDHDAASVSTPLPFQPAAPKAAADGPAIFTLRYHRLRPL